MSSQASPYPQTSTYPERVYSSGGGSRGLSRGGVSAGWMLAGLAGLGLAAWMAWRFSPDLRRYLKMERM